MDYRKRMNEAGYKRSGHVLQYHELMSVYIGKWGGYLTLAVNILALGSLGVVQIIACASDVHILAPGVPDSFCCRLLTECTKVVGLACRVR